MRASGWRGALAVAAAAVAGCGGARAELSPLPASALTAAVAWAEEEARIRQPTRLTFSWRAREPGVRGSGLGVARLGPPDRARLDLFLENGESAAIAALEGGHLRTPPNADPQAAIPRSALLWAALGVYRPGEGAEVVEGGEADDLLEMLVRLPDGDLVRYRMRGGELNGAALMRGGKVVESVELMWAEAFSGYPSAATYRNLYDYRELELSLESVDHVEAFPPHIWHPGRW
ncbi:MAG: hypothetical protein OXG58_06630 [Gemmatimonadetes bacterium]|nr:hypothetical protein [Gemmatimonadota bacterium]MCY3944087.1 hypothetical protein [Gemmatimonadota bacterium]